MSIYFINGKCYKLKSEKSHKNCLTKHTWFISHHITPLVVNAIEGEHVDTHKHTHTHTHTHILMHKTKQLQVTKHSPATGKCMPG